MINFYQRVQRPCIAGIVIILLQACTVSPDKTDGPPAEDIDISTIREPVPKVEPPSRYGNPESYIVNGIKYYVRSDAKSFIQRGIASWYGRKFHGRRTSSGEIFDMYKVTAAHTTLPLPTYVQVKNLINSKTIIVKINDRGPFHENRIIDLSYAAAAKLDLVRDGTGLVEIRTLDATGIADDKSSSLKKNTGILPKLYIQVGSFSDYLNAARLKDRLKMLKQDTVHINETTVSNKKLFRVWIGPVSDINAADTIVASLKKHGINEHRIVVDL